MMGISMTKEEILRLFFANLNLSAAKKESHDAQVSFSTTYTNTLKISWKNGFDPRNYFQGKGMNSKIRFGNSKSFFTTNINRGG